MDTFAQYQAQAARLLRSPDDAAALVEQFALLARRGEHTDAQLALAARAAALAPADFVAMFDYGSALMRASRYRESLDVFRRCLALAKGDDAATAMHHIGMAHHDLGNFCKAIAWYDQAIALVPEDRELRRSRGIARLCSGRLAEGLFDFEITWQEPAEKPIARSGIPRWRGEPLDGKTIIVSHEQGFGDTIQFCRFLPRLKPRRVVFSGPPELTGLLSEELHADDWIGETGPFEADYYASPLSAAAALAIGYKDVSGEPYLTAAPLRLDARGKIKVGLVWRGSPGYRQDAVRSMRLADLCPLFELPGTAFYSLQVGPAGREISALGLDGFIADLTALIKDWRDTARAVMAMDVVVSVDTAVAHLAGALGKPVFLLLPFSCCWRWMRSRDDTPWYRSTRLYRQTVPNQWSGPVARVRSKLARML